MGMAPQAPRDTEQARHVRQKLWLARTTVLTCFSALLILFTVLTLIQTEPQWKLWLVQVIPLAIFIPGLWRGHHRTYSWLCFVILIYFTWSVANTISPLSYWRDYLVVTLSVILFIGAMMASRWRQQWWLWETTARDSGSTTTDA
ncbi:DUF2069 domain-containing protein [Marinimicrobium agarilyticum]|uniref:DUF2069 domain-containing protein n=1 Tax=Marinimicrobium agarilyticum TaxID=306546 RepID=UPI00040E3EA2|nr:DUF2069 domain-containing protein [Marinimicrobium agarilyticum]